MRRLAASALVFCVANAGADLPRDPERTSDRVRNGRVRIGVVENARWAMRRGDDVAGIEADLAREFAKQFNATPEWHFGGEQAHMEALERFQLDLVIGGITKKTAWKSKIGMSDTYFGEHVIATAPGENGWIKKLDEFLSARQPEIQRAAEEQNAK